MGSKGLGGSDLHPALYVGFGDFARKFPPTPTAYGVWNFLALFKIVSRADSRAFFSFDSLGEGKD